MIAISDTSPLILLDKIDHLWILGKLFQKIIIPPSVDAEWLRPGGYRPPDWLFLESLSPEANDISKELSQKIDKGEAEAIALFSTRKVDFLLLDDLKGRQVAKSKGFAVVGTLGVLVSAKQKGFINNLGITLEALQRQRFYITDEALKKALSLVNEM